MVRYFIWHNLFKYALRLIDPMLLDSSFKLFNEWCLWMRKLGEVLMLHCTFFIYVTYWIQWFLNRLKGLHLSKKTNITEKVLEKSSKLNEKLRISTWCWVNIKNVRAQLNELRFLASIGYCPFLFAEIPAMLNIVRKQLNRTSLVAQWLRISLPIQETWVRSLVQEDPTCRGAIKPVRHNYWACALEPTSHSYWSPRA